MKTVAAIKTRILKKLEILSQLRMFVTFFGLSIVHSTFNSDYFRIVACILNGQSQLCYSQYKNIDCFVEMELQQRKALTAYIYLNILLLFYCQKRHLGVFN
jgi:hypothetical protein